jgi:predicted AAA+ superfamily ATPase
MKEYFYIYTNIFEYGRIFRSSREVQFLEWQCSELGFIRKDYTDKIFDYTGNKLIKVLVGQRRTGKSYLLRQIANRLIEGGKKPKIYFILTKSSPISIL